ncbi:uncharacterized protein E0L32_007307 [Thyridium curvatum]|uniref:Uncharacterized protein n=1 Tax=Thyridium curvatum TaxID=1093900 RepID=A0A507AZX6_9PEZI|nr:uncharacterized protein E0L32_007307 [Thyridium curvatum]TPX12004.1 hypothetical protein E0L32_007307 [Thyridium curvatum]
MLEYFTYKKYKKHKAEKEAHEHKVGDKGKGIEKQDGVASNSNPAIRVDAPAGATTATAERPLLDDEDESFFERLTSGRATLSDLDGNDDDERPPLPPRIKTPDLTWDSDAESFVSRESKSKSDEKKKEGKDKHKDKKEKDKKAEGGGAAANIGRRISLLVKRPKKDVQPTNLVVPESEAKRERTDIERVLDDLDLSAKNNRAFSLSAESSELVRRFTLVLKDLVNGVPTAVGDMQALLEDKDGAIAAAFGKLPSSLKKLVTQLPTKLTSTLAPELLAAAAETQGLKHEDNSKAGVKSTAKSLLMPKNLQDLVTKPSAIVGMLKAIMNALKLRWPAFMGANVLWSIALFRKLFFLSTSSSTTRSPPYIREPESRLRSRSFLSFKRTEF